MEVNSIGMIVVVGMLLCVFLAVVGSVVFAVSKKRLSLGSVVAGLLCLFLLLPVAAVLMYFLSYSSPRPATPGTRGTQAFGNQSDEAVREIPARIDPRSLVHEPGAGNTVDAPVSGTTESPAAVAEVPASDPEPTPEPTPPRPDWIKQGVVKEGDTTLILLMAVKATPQRAEDDVLRQATALVRKNFQKHHAHAGAWTLPTDVVATEAIKQTFTEQEERNLGSVSAVMHRVYAQVELSPEVRQAVYPVWREQIVEMRIWELGGLLGVITLLLGTVAGYLRIDALTAGVYRGRLKIAAASLIVAGGLGAVAVLAKV